MRYRWKTLTLSLALAAPLVLGQIAVAQTLPATPEIRQAVPVLVAQEGEKEVQAFYDWGYSYWDAVMLAKFWGEGISDAKWRAGDKLLGPPESKLYLRLLMTDVRVKALRNVENLDLFSKAGYSYDDAKALAQFWGKESAWEGKLFIERNLILGNESLLAEALDSAR